MYDELIKKLRHCGDERIPCEGCSGYNECQGFADGAARNMIDAADAIEEMNRMERDFRQYISDQMKREKGVYACCYCKNRESAYKYEPGCTHEECDGVSGWEYGTPTED